MKELEALKKRYLEEAQLDKALQRKLGYDPLERLYYTMACLSLGKTAPAPAKKEPAKKK